MRLLRYSGAVFAERGCKWPHQNKTSSYIFFSLANKLFEIKKLRGENFILR